MENSWEWYLPTALTSETKLYTLKQVKWFFQKLFRGYSDCDIWNLDTHIAGLLYVRLKAFRKAKRIGVPIVDPWKNDNGVPVCFTEEEWNKVLDDMIEAFRLISKKQEYTDVKFTEKPKSERVNELDCGTFDEAHIKRNQEAIKKGFELFHKHYFSLWD